MNEVDELLLEHFGTKGMKWGVRTKHIKQRMKTNSYKSVRENQRRRDDRIERWGGKKGKGYTGVVKAKLKSDKNKKIAITLASIAGTAAVAAGAIYAKKHMRVPVKQIPVTTSDQHKAFMEEFNRNQRRINSAANQSLRYLYNQTEAPIHRRDYLPTWS